MLLLLYVHFLHMTPLTAKEKEQEDSDKISLTTRPSPSHPTSSHHQPPPKRSFPGSLCPGVMAKNTKNVELVSGASRCHTIKNWLRQALPRRIFHSTRSHFGEMRLMDTGFFLFALTRQSMSSSHTYCVYVFFKITCPSIHSFPLIN